MTVDFSNQKVVFSERVVSLIGQFRQVEAKMPEAGGMFFGTLRPNLTLVERVSLPNELDRRCRYWFIGSAKASRILTEYEFHNSDGYSHYLGEWHTHPELKPVPSPKDKWNIARQIKKGKPMNGYLIAVILGLEEDLIIYQNEYSREERYVRF